MLNFTRQERAVIYFLVVSLGVGAALKLIKEKRLAEELVPDRFYEEQEEFLEIAQKINAGELESDHKSASKNDEMIGSEGLDEAISDSALEKININSAGVSELSKLPGIGPVLAQRIRTYIENNGPFEVKEEIILVKGIGENLYSRIQDLVTLE